MKSCVIAARSGGFPELVKDGETGYLVSENDPAALAEAIEKLSVKDARMAMGSAARDHIRRVFSEELMATRFLDAVRRILSVSDYH